MQHASGNSLRSRNDLEYWYACLTTSHLFTILLLSHSAFIKPYTSRKPQPVIIIHILLCYWWATSSEKDSLPQYQLCAIQF